MLEILLLAAWIMVGDGAYCYEEVSSGVFAPCAIKIGETEIEGNPMDIWQFGTQDNMITWRGSPFCVEGWFPSAPEAIQMQVGACVVISPPQTAPISPSDLILEP